MNKISLNISLYVALLLLLSLYSCEKLIGDQNGPERIETKIKYIGYEYVILEVEAIGFEYDFDFAKFETVNSDFNSWDSSTVLDYEVDFQNKYYPQAVGLDPDSIYYGRPRYGEMTGSRVKLVSNKAEFPCTISEYNVSGDLTGGQFGPINSYYYLNDWHSETMSSNLSGDFTFIDFEIPYGKWGPGVYTSYDKVESFYHKPMSRNARITLTGTNQVEYIAKQGQPFIYDDSGYSNFHIRFCNLVFLGDDGSEITLSVNLTGR